MRASVVSENRVAKISAKEIAERILALLPEDGTPVLNRVMRIMLSRELQRPVEPDLYFAARDLLLKNQKIGRLRGQGGQLFLLTEQPSKQPVTQGAEVGTPWPEHRLMSPLRQYLEGAFRQGLDLPDEGVCIVHETASFGPQRGQWARPDYIMVTAMRFKLLPGSQVDVHSFELKTETGGTVQAVHEALAQTRFTHFGHLVWHLPEGSKAEARLADIAKHCDEHGIGLIRMRDPVRPETYEILLDPVRKPTPSIVVEGFLESRLSADQRNTLSRLVHGERK
ncbi:MAG TPA: hypothetical protein VHA77_18335 [Xanthobacteraceae bacterium]|nr:hypothetical protein [Xanthobacteraceae bacterium]